MFAKKEPVQKIINRIRLATTMGLDFIQQGVAAATHAKEKFEEILRLINELCDERGRIKREHLHEIDDTILELQELKKQIV